MSAPFQQRQTDLPVHELLTKMLCLYMFLFFFKVNFHFIFSADKLPSHVRHTVILIMYDIFVYINSIVFKKLRCFSCVVF
jgi:hypothetical protein